MKQNELKQISKRSYGVTFNYKVETFKSEFFGHVTKLFENVTEWLHNQGYKFNDPKIHNGVFSRLYSTQEINGVVKTKHRIPQVFPLNNGMYYSYDRTENYCSQMIVKMLQKHGCSNIVVNRELSYIKPLIKG